MLIQKTRLCTHCFDNVEVELLGPLEDCSAVFIPMSASSQQFDFLSLAHLSSQLDHSPPHNRAAGEIEHDPTVCVALCVSGVGEISTALCFGIFALWGERIFERK